MKIVNINAENAAEHSFFCIKNTRAPGFKAKADWFRKRFGEGLKLKVIYADDGKQVGFIEYVPAEYAWRPVEAPGWFFIHCIMVYPDKYRHSGAASKLIREAIKDTGKLRKKGVCTMTSEGPWIASQHLFEKNGFVEVDQRGRFSLMALKQEKDAPHPFLLNWEIDSKQLKGWHLFYADQCPWHHKGVKAISEAAVEKGIDLQVTRVNSAAEARKLPSGFGTFALMYDGKLLADHYLSRRRFETIAEQNSQSGNS